jgi:glyoxalase family protein
MESKILGIHHITAIAGDAQTNLDFYTGTMGMRLVKKTINQDAPDTYHLFYADAVGTPGTDLTFFPGSEMGSAKLGTGFAVEVLLAVPKGSLSYWQERFKKERVTFNQIETRFDEKVLPFKDPHDLSLALVEIKEARVFVPWEKSPVPPDHQIRGVHSVRLWERDLRLTERVLTEVMQFEQLGTEAGWHRYGLKENVSGKIIEIRELPEERRGRWGAGSVHHIAWRVRDSDEEIALRHALITAGLRPTEQIDRFWFKSVYFREPGGVLFELATDGPGFSLDEKTEYLGQQLVLPPWLESRRKEIEAALPTLILRNNPSCHLKTMDSKGQNKPD